MKKTSLWALTLVLGVLTFSACSSDDKNEPLTPPEQGGNEESQDSFNIEYNSKNATSWCNYMTQVASLLEADATTLYNNWEASFENGKAYKDYFKGLDSKEALEQILEGCCDIAGEVGDAKIGDPYNLFIQGKTTEALYAVESWYSWHSRDDYKNNIISVRNSYFGSRDENIAEASMAELIRNVNPELDQEVKDAIQAAYNAIDAIPQPFRNNINSSEAQEAMKACGDLNEVLAKASSFIDQADLNESAMEAVVKNYVDQVVMPTYAELKQNNKLLADAVKAFASNPSNALFEKACEAWLAARMPWETSEAFLFGPVDELGLDPNMDSWPLDQDAIVNILNSGKYENLNWSDGDDDDAIEAAQSVRGFHTLEFLLFKDGKARTIH
ncbi:MAG: peptidase M75 [Bacteroidaceae bacterium]|nr:peptidase M75 [Bacteroidaceae bacterium]